MVKTIVDPHVKGKLDAHAHAINSAPSNRHRIGTFMRGGLTGYGECQNAECRASFNVGYPVNVPHAEPIATDDTASGTRCPNLLT